MVSFNCQPGTGWSPLGRVVLGIVYTRLVCGVSGQCLHEVTDVDNTTLEAGAPDLCDSRITEPSMSDQASSMHAPTWLALLLLWLGCD